MPTDSECVEATEWDHKFEYVNNIYFKITTHSYLLLTLKNTLNMLLPCGWLGLKHQLTN